jgi:HEAT repeat protein
VLEALEDTDERRVILALQLAQRTRDRATMAATRECLQRPSPAIRAAAIQTLEAMGARDPEGAIERMIADPNDAVRKAAVSFRLTRGRHPVEAARGLLDQGDAGIQRHVLEVMLDHPQVGSALTPSWVDARRASERPDDRQLAALALGVLSGRLQVEALGALLRDPDVEVRRAALQSAARRPSAAWLEALMPMLLEPEVAHEARQAVAAVGEPAVRALRPWLQGEHGPSGQTVAARTLARIGGRRAIDALAPLLRGRDVWLRHLGFQALVQMRVSQGPAVLSKAGAHRLFVRELREYRALLEPARALEGSAVPEIKLLAESYQESAEMALERGLQALACAYEPQPLLGALERLRSGDAEAIAPALEYLGHLLPRAVYRPLGETFERPADVAPDPERTDVTPDPARVVRPLGHWIRMAWESEDAWLRACAVRASRYDSSLDRRQLRVEETAPEIVRRELEARLESSLEGLGHGLPRGEPTPC